MTNIVMAAGRFAALVACLFLISAVDNPVRAQDAPLKYPAEGLPILDCDPVAPVPADSCILRVPPSFKRGRIERDSIGDTAATFNFVSDSNRLPNGLTLSRSIVLIDLSPGENGGRKATWPRERAMVASLLRALPATEQVAVYGFNERLEQLSDFTLDRNALVSVVEQLELRGANTRIATNVRDAVEILGRQENTILKSLILVSDGLEEGERDPAEVTRQAITNGVTISGLAMLWGPVGASANGAGMDYMQLLSEGTRGESRAIQLRGPAAEDAKLSDFIAGIVGAHGGSGLIVPEGTPVAANISVAISRPISGQAGQFREETARARFIPAAERHGTTPPPASTAPQEQTGWLDREWLGVRSLWWLVGALAAAVAAALVFVVLRSRKAGTELELELDPAGDGWNGGADEFPTSAAPAPTGPSLAYLLRDDQGTRVAIRAPRVTIGRSSTCDIEISDGSISRLHAELEQQRDGTFVLSDAGSLNGTMLNGQKLSRPETVKPGDIVTLGKVQLRFSQA